MEQARARQPFLCKCERTGRDLVLSVDFPTAGKAE